MTSAGKHQKLYRSGFLCSGLTLFPIKVVRVGLWCQWDSSHPIFRCFWPLYLSTPHTCRGDREKQGHAGKWESSKYHWRQGERGCAQRFSRSGSPAWNICVPARLGCPSAGVAFASRGQDLDENLITLITWLCMCVRDHMKVMAKVHVLLWLASHFLWPSEPVGLPLLISAGLVLPCWYPLRSQTL